MSSGPTSRDELTSRTLPQMTLSTTPNPLTLPIQTQSHGSLSAVDRAIKRFAIHGNAIVTGGAGNLALEATQGILEHGLAGVCLLDVASSLASSKERIASLCQEFPHAKIITQTVDVTDERDVEAAVEQAVGILGSIDILLCFAGVVGCTHSVNVTAEGWRRVLEVNLTGTWFCAQSVGRQMIKQSTGGSMVFTASVSAHRVNFPQPQAAYNASKAGLLQLKSSLAAEWARHGIRVNSISPGYMDTILNKGDGLEEARNIWTSRNPMGRMGDPTELTGAVVLLCSQAGRYINGADIIVDGER
ncbi:hypothetical protein BD779DRAFT_1610993 [Infundibulicybe gibba]|nr:hypothetical protein BD779DRAFT_1610993 [Infundibulicybe gibba]